RALDDALLAEDHGPDRFANPGNVLERPLRGGDHFGLAQLLFLRDEAHGPYSSGTGVPDLSVHKMADKRNNSDYFVSMNNLDPKADAGAGAAGLEALISRAVGAGKGLPPVERWNPPFGGVLDMAIRRDASWYYLGTPIGRERLLRPGSPALRKDEQGRACVVTPAASRGL